MNASAFESIQARRLSPWQGEEEVRLTWNRAIEDATGLTLNAERNRKDTSLNHVIIEYKAPGLFKGSKSSAAFKNAMSDRLLKYIRKEAKDFSIPESDFIGIAIDGEHVCFAQVIDGDIIPQHLMPFSKASVEMVLDAFRSDTRKALTSENILTDFGHGSESARSFFQSLSDGLYHYISMSNNNKIKMLFKEWRTLYGQVADMSDPQAEAINKELSFHWKGDSSDSIPARLFVIHTYNSLLMKLLASEIVAAHELTSFRQPAQSLAAVKSDSELIEFLDKDIERSEFFQSVGIKGFVEEAIFSWYIDVLRDNAAPLLLPSLRRLLSVLSLYRLDKLERTRDVLRDLYHGLIPGKLRQSLGEFYTPDWLVDFTLGRASNERLLDKRVLDPTCGSGAFLLAIIRSKRRLALDAGWSDTQTIQHLCESVWGFDLNPLAVQTARVNFLIEIADLLRNSPGIEIEIPILMADAIYSPAEDPKKNDSIVQYQIGSHVAQLDVQLPSELAFDRALLDYVFETMGNHVEQGLEYSELHNKLVKQAVIFKEKIESWEEPLKYTYDQVLKLHRKNWNGIWFRIVRNFFWSATAGKFDLIIGNPPWVRWSKLPELYRDRVKPTCEHYGIFSNTRRHGGNELDISAMITYTVADKWLRNNGALAFVITGTLFKNPSSAGFRTFKIEPNLEGSKHLQPVTVDDMGQIKPFEDASNHTTVAIFKKSDTPAVYPIEYNLWKAKDSYTRSIPTKLPLSNVLNRIDSVRNEAFPVDSSGSPWAILLPGRFEAIKYLSNQCAWTQGRKGITTDLNGVYFVPILKDNGSLVQIRSRPEAGRKDIGPEKKSWIEPDLLFPLIKGAGDFEECYLRLNSENYNQNRLYVFIPNKGISNQDYEDAREKLSLPKLRKTAAWFRSFESLLLNRSTFRRQMKGAPPHAIYNVGDYTFKPWKVVWPEMSSSFYAAVAGSADVPVIGRRPFIPDHKVYFASFDSKEVAHFLCGMLNTSTVQEWIASHNVSIQVADIFKHLDLPEYNPKENEHVKLSNLVMSAHAEHNIENRKEIIRKIKHMGESILLNWAAAKK